MILVIHRAIQRAFEIIRKRSPEALATMLEDDITIALRGVLENQLRKDSEVPGFNRQMFEKVDRQHRCTSYDGKHIGKEPDMRFVLRDDSRTTVLSSEDGLTTECKPVDDTHAPGPHYCDRGIRRFVIGEYAWATQEALMVGYVRGDRTIPKTLIPAMKKTKQVVSLKTTHHAQPALPSSPGPLEPLYESLHSRGFPWRENKGNACAIKIYHSWHAC